MAAGVASAARPVMFSEVRRGRTVGAAADVASMGGYLAELRSQRHRGEPAQPRASGAFRRCSSELRRAIAGRRWVLLPLVALAALAPALRLGRSLSAAVEGRHPPSAHMQQQQPQPRPSPRADSEGPSARQLLQELIQEQRALAGAVERLAQEVRELRGGAACRSPASVQPD
eukprot:TRINITY_DN13592_c0_g1_i1.p1 TRINITY_DN13592_c0_g1~~TRINITY_DN13592_c0_g1_i1.p1  ORF type:complete len:193 (+),score=55.87 TRINITY_DN13592_c0_g1_i1:66-581(+)